MPDAVRSNAQWLVGLLVLLGAVLHPVTRPIVMFILPLGVKPDDVIIVIFVIMFILVWRKIRV